MSALADLVNARAQLELGRHNLALACPAHRAQCQAWVDQQAAKVAELEQRVNHPSAR